MINNQGTPSFELQINFGVLQIDTENSAPEVDTKQSWNGLCNLQVNAGIKSLVNKVLSVAN